MPSGAGVATCPLHFHLYRSQPLCGLDHDRLLQRERFETGIDGWIDRFIIESESESIAHHHSPLQDVTSHTTYARCTSWVISTVYICLFLFFFYVYVYV